MLAAFQEEEVKQTFTETKNISKVLFLYFIADQPFNFSLQFRYSSKLKCTKIFISSWVFKISWDLILSVLESIRVNTFYSTY